jgi:hypothetical protein
MLFDLQGKRRRMVQATYLTLAVLMGGGLVLFGIGGDVSGGLFDAFSDRSGGTGNDVVEERVERLEERVRDNPDALQARKDLVRDYYSLAGAQMAEGATSFPPEARDELRKAAANWQAYLEREKGEPDPVVARYALQIFDMAALDRPKAAEQAARVIAEDQNDSSSYLLLTQYAALAGDDRTANLAGQKALALAPKSDRKEVKKAVEQAKAAKAALDFQRQQQEQQQP